MSPELGHRTAPHRAVTLSSVAGLAGLTGPRTPKGSTSRAFSMGAFSGSFGGGRISVGRSLPPSPDILGSVTSLSLPGFAAFESA